METAPPPSRSNATSGCFTRTAFFGENLGAAESYFAAQVKEKGPHPAARDGKQRAEPDLHYDSMGLRV